MDKAYQKLLKNVLIKDKIELKNQFCDNETK